MRPLTAEDLQPPIPTPAPAAEAEIDLYVKRWGVDETEVRTNVIIDWMQEGDLGPLGVHLAEGRIYPWVAYALVRMINEGRLKVVRRKGGRPRKLECSARDFIIADEYKAGTGSAAAARKRLAAKYGLGEKAVQAAITRVRKIES
jgi:hypothetical protein